MKRRVFVTGIGVVSALGSELGEFWDNCLAGASVVARVPEHWRGYADYRSDIWSPLPPLDELLAGATRVERSQNGTATLIGARAASEALEHAGFERVQKSKRANTYTLTGVDPGRAGVYMGTGLGGAHTFFGNHAFHVLSRSRQALSELSADVAKDPALGQRIGAIAERMAHGSRFNPFSVSMLMPNAISAFPGIKYSLTGPNLTYTLACASGTAAIGHAFRAVRSGQVDLALAGGAEYPDDYYGASFQGFDTTRALVRDCARPDSANRPFDAARSGFLFSQGGAAVLVLESEEHAVARRHGAIAEIAGYGESFDAHSMMGIAPHGAEMEGMLHAALHDAGITPGDIQYVNAHGTGTQANDPIEAALIGRVFGREVLVNSTKSLLGHTLGASGALEAAVTALSLKHQTTHVCRNLETPIADLAFVTEPGPCRIDAAVSQSFAFGGHNAGIVMRRAG